LAFLRKETKVKREEGIKGKEEVKEGKDELRANE